MWRVYVRDGRRDLLPRVLAAMMPHVALMPDVACSGLLCRQGGRGVRLPSVGRHAATASDVPADMTMR